MICNTVNNQERPSNVVRRCRCDPAPTQYDGRGLVGSDPSGEGIGVANSPDPYIAVRLSDDGSIYPRHVNPPRTAAARSAIGQSIDDFVMWTVRHAARVMRD